ncbi:MAG: hypothetical protein ACRCT7_12905 [Shewanella sp.]
MNTAPLKVKVSAGLDVGALIEALACSRHVIMHAALYSRFANGVVDEVLQQQLSQGKLQRLRLISTSTQVTWLHDFNQVLRQGASAAAIASEWHASARWVSQLVNRYPQQVQAIETEQLPTQPMILTDSRLFLGHYAHSATPAAQGFWLELDIAPLTLDLGSDSLAFTPTNDAWSQALSRHLDECRQVLQRHQRAENEGDMR